MRFIAVGVALLCLTVLAPSAEAAPCGGEGDVCPTYVCVGHHGIYLSEHPCGIKGTGYGEMSQLESH